LALEKESSKIKMLESIKCEKEIMEENLNFTYDFVKTEKENKEVLDAYL